MRLRQKTALGKRAVNTISGAIVVANPTADPLRLAASSVT